MSDFDPDWYRQRYPDVDASGFTPSEHYRLIGAALGRTGAPQTRDTPKIVGRRHHERRREIARQLRSGLDDFIFTDMHGRRTALAPAPCFASREYDLEPTLTGPVRVLALREYAPSPDCFESMTIGVHLHLHYPELLDEFLGWLRHMPVRFTLLISVTERGTVGQVLEKAKRQLPRAKIQVRPVPNRGRDIASFVTEFGEELLEFDLIAHFHTKRSPHNVAKADWRAQLLHNLLGSRNYLTNLLALFARNPHLGMVFPEYHWSLQKQISWGGNYTACEELAERLGLEISPDRLRLFPAGSMFWARPEALSCLLKAGLTPEDFPTEAGQVDGTMAHAVERLFGEIVRREGFQLQQVKADRQHALASYYTANWLYKAPDTKRMRSRVEAYRQANDGRRNRVAVFTAIAGGYEDPLLHEILDPSIDFYLFTDSPAKDRGFWRVREMDYHHPDPVRKARYVKTHAHKYLSDYEVVIWIDANVMVCGDLMRYVERMDSEHKIATYGIDHPHRRCLYEEARILIAVRKDEPELIRRQIAHYREAGYPTQSGLIETNFMVFDMQCPQLTDFLRCWWGQIARFSYRDQLSVNYALWQTGAHSAATFSENRSLRSHPDFAYFGHGVNTGWSNDIPDIGETVSPRFPLSQSSPSDDRTGVDIVICVHNALGAVRKCLGAVRNACRDQDNIIIVDDASDAPTAEFLQQWCEDHTNVRLLRNDGQPRGYCRAANTGMRAGELRYLLLLNSDAVVSLRAIDKMLAVAESDPEVAVVGPVSNAASSQSIPEIKGSAGQTAINLLPEGIDVEAIDNWLAQRSEVAVTASVPLVHGFCQLIRRSVAREVGFFDEQAFPEGYGEENDFCFRVGNAGYDLRVAVDCFVYHIKSASYTDDDRRMRLMQAGRQALIQKHGQTRLQNAVRCMETHPTLEALRQDARAKFSAWNEGQNFNDQ